MEQSEILAAIQVAGVERRTLIITAKNADGTVETREVEPYSFHPGGGPTGEYRLFFWCRTRGAIRNVYSNSITSAEVTDTTFEPRYPVEIGADVARAT